MPLSVAGDLTFDLSAIGNACRVSATVTLQNTDGEPRQYFIKPSAPAFFAVTSSSGTLDSGESTAVHVTALCVENDGRLGGRAWADDSRLHSRGASAEHKYRGAAAARKLESRSRNVAS